MYIARVFAFVSAPLVLFICHMKLYSCWSRFWFLYSGNFERIECLVTKDFMHEWNYLPPCSYSYSRDEKGFTVVLQVCQRIAWEFWLFFLTAPQGKWSPQQKWVGVLLVALLFFNNPFFAAQVSSVESYSVIKWFSMLCSHTETAYQITCYNEAVSCFVVVVPII